MPGKRKHYRAASSITACSCAADNAPAVLRCHPHFTLQHHIKSPITDALRFLEAPLAAFYPAVRGYAHITQRQRSAAA